MEIVVATTIFAIVVTALLSLFNYVLKINRRTEALRQATQGMRNVVEFLTKEIRNGQIDYSVANGRVGNPVLPCLKPPLYAVNQSNRNESGNDVYGQNQNVQFNHNDNRLGIITEDGLRECIFFADANGNSIDTNANGSGFASGTQLIMAKIVDPTSDPVRVSLSPANFKVVKALFRVRPLQDPYTVVGGSPKIQPSVSMYFEFLADLPTGEQFPIYYQTTVSSDKYDVPTGDIP